jgi:hypothetical protein
MNLDFDVLPMIPVYCPICRSGPKIDCSDMNRCPLALAKFKGEILSPEDFASKHGARPTSYTVEHQPPAANKTGQFTLF